MSQVIEVGEKLQTEALSWQDQAEAFQVTNQEQYIDVTGVIKDIKALARKITDHHGPLKRSARATWQSIVDAEKEMLDPLTLAESVLKQKAVDWKREYDRKRAAEERRIAEEHRRRVEAARKAEEEEQRRQQEEYRKRQEEEALAAAEAAELDGASPEEVEAVLDEKLETPSAPPPPPVPAYVAPPAPPPLPPPANVKGFSTAKTWAGRCDDITELARAVGAGEVSENLLKVNQTALNQMARGMQTTFNIPGCVAVSTETARSGSR